MSREMKNQLNEQLAVIPARSWKKSREHPDKFGKPKTGDPQPNKKSSKNSSGRGDGSAAPAPKKSSGVDGRPAGVEQSPKAGAMMNMPNASEIALRQLVETKEKFFPTLESWAQATGFDLAPEEEKPELPTAVSKALEDIVNILDGEDILDRLGSIGIRLSILAAALSEDDVRRFWLFFWGVVVEFFLIWIWKEMG